MWCKKQISPLVRAVVKRWAIHEGFDFVSMQEDEIGGFVSFGDYKRLSSEQKEAFMAGYKACYDAIEDYDHDYDKERERVYKEWKKNES